MKKYKFLPILASNYQKSGFN